MRSCVIKIHNLPETNEPVHHITVKPIGLLIGIIILGLVFIIRYPYFVAAGFSLIMLATFALLVMPDRTLITFTKEYMILYNLTDRTSWTMIYWEDIVNWQYERHMRNDQLVVNLVNGTSEFMDVYSKRSVARYLEQYAPGKEKHQIGVGQG